MHLVLLDIVDFFNDIFRHPDEVINPEALITYGGMALLFFAVFAQTGLFFCFFFPGDALLFTAGVFTATGVFHHRIEIVCISIVTAAFLGNLCGYWFGRSTGPLLFKRKDSWFFKQHHLAIANKFFNSYGGLALTVGFFLPIIRTFTPIISGVIKYTFVRFTMFSALGAILWANTLVLSGYLLGNVPFVKKNLEFIVVGMILVITLPVLFKLFREVGKLKTK